MYIHASPFVYILSGMSCSETRGHIWRCFGSSQLERILLACGGWKPEMLLTILHAQSSSRNKELSGPQYHQCQGWFTLWIAPPGSLSSFLNVDLLLYLPGYASPLFHPKSSYSFFRTCCQHHLLALVGPCDLLCSVSPYLGYATHSGLCWVYVCVTDLSLSHQTVGSFWVSSESFFVSVSPELITIMPAYSSQ